MISKLVPKSVIESLDNTHSRYRIFPFIWLHEAPWDRVEDELNAIYNCGLRSVCLESRPFPHFCEDAWWEQVGRILEYAKKRDMQVWILDDKKFPTGCCNDMIEKKYPHLRTVNARIAFIDVCGPLKDACHILPNMKEEESIISVSAFKRTGKDEDVDGETGILLTKNIHDELVYWDIPDGIWRIFFIIKTSGRPSYIDMCNAESCRLMIDEIYEPHYTHFKEYFGNTLQGFFSDEPCFANMLSKGEAVLGNQFMNVPWKKDMIVLLAEKMGFSKKKAETLLPALWFNVTGYTALMRLAFMDTVTELYRDNFSNLLGSWCEKHGVSYIGHVIEDNGGHTQLGNRAGHYFRALDGQHMSGIDIVLHQILPGHTEMLHTMTNASQRLGHPDFYHFTIGKLATSAAHLDEKKAGRSMAEIYGAFGWAEGVPTMKYITDVVLSSGINHFVPHAFSDKIEDPDCPPLFYNGGRNPQYHEFGVLMGYLSRASHIIGNAKAAPPVAVYYNAEGEWAGGGFKCIDECAAILGKCQTDFDFVSKDHLLKAEASSDGLKIGGCTYKALFVPYCRIIPQMLAEKLCDLSNAGVTIFYIDELPEKDEFDNLLSLKGEIIESDKLPLIVEKYGFSSVRLSSQERALRVLSLKDGDFTLYFFFNADTQNAVDTHVLFEESPTVAAYDCWENRITSINTDTYHLRLEPAHTVIWCVSNKKAEKAVTDGYWKNLETDDIFVELIENGKIIFTETLNQSTLYNYAVKFPKFSGIVRYTFNAIVDEDILNVRLTRVGETARLRINGSYCGTAVQAPYSFNVESHLKSGRNEIIVEVAANQGYARRDSFSFRLPLPPTGLFGPIEAFVKNNKN